MAGDAPPVGLMGGFAAGKAPDSETAALLTSVKADVEKQLGTTFATFEPHSVRTQVVAGTNYRAKVHVGDEKYVHLVVHQPLPHTKEGPKLVSAEGGKGLADAL